MIVWRSVAAARAYLRVGIELVKVGVKIKSLLSLKELQLLAPDRQMGEGTEPPAAVDRAGSTGSLRRPEGQRAGSRRAVARCCRLPGKAPSEGASLSPWGR